MGLRWYLFVAQFYFHTLRYWTQSVLTSKLQVLIQHTLLSPPPQLCLGSCLDICHGEGGNEAIFDSFASFSFLLSSVPFSTLFGTSRVERREGKISGGQSLLWSELLLMAEQGPKATFKQGSFHWGWEMRRSFHGLEWAREHPSGLSHLGRTLSLEACCLG